MVRISSILRLSGVSLYPVAFSLPPTTGTAGMVPCVSLPLWPLKPVVLDQDVTQWVARQVT